MTIKNYDAAYEKVMQDLREISPEDLLAELRSYEIGPLGQVFCVPKEAVNFHSELKTGDSPQYKFVMDDTNFVSVDLNVDSFAANDNNFALAA